MESMALTRSNEDCWIICLRVEVVSRVVGEREVDAGGTTGRRVSWETAVPAVRRREGIC